tara:strand:+ start:6447 stop:7070 length:624 start_codon:yes stop_codon:yes gene_type:complete
MGSYIPPPAFHTFDPIRLSPDDVFGAISKSMRGEHEDLLVSISDLRGVSLEEGSAPPVDQATLLFISVLDWQKDGSSPRPLDSGHSMERLGRFPSNDGNAIEYLLEYCGEDESGGHLHLLLSKLGRGLSEGSLGESGFSKGSGGIELLGWLDATEVSDLRKEIEKGGWSVMSREPLDGGVQDAFRHLLVFLRAAGRSKSGLLMRRHT